jgi:DNA sulfur modification protein DndD
MIIKKIVIENYLCYVGIKEFELSEGLNIVLGENGEGKTKLFEAIEWLLNGDNKNLELLVSAKTLAETAEGDTFRVRVVMHFEQHEETKIIARSFTVKKLEGDEYATTNYALEGIEENRSGERSPIDGKALLDRVFPLEIRRYSLFKGEAELDIFNNTDALSILINSFSSAKHYEKYTEKGEFLREKAEKAVDDATKSNTKNQQEYKRLELEIQKLINDKGRIETHLNFTEEQIQKTEENIQEADKYVTNAEALETINNRIKNIDDQINSVANLIDENYTTSLFDENWMLVNFESLHKAYSKKISTLAEKKRILQSEFDKEIGIKEGKKLLKAELLNNSIPLPIGVPSKAHMEEMISAELCKVCNRPAEKGSEAYTFMFERLQDYLKSQDPVKPEKKERKTLFEHNYMDRLFNLSVNHEDNLSSLRGVRNKIKDLFEFNSDKKKVLEELEEKRAKEVLEREKVIGSSNIAGEKLASVLKNYNAWQRDLKTHNKEQIDYKKQINDIDKDLIQKKEDKEAIDTKSANPFFISTRGILRDIESIFIDTKEKKFDEFIGMLQAKSNSIFERINVESFTGTIVFTKKTIGGKTNINLELQEDGRTFYKPNQSLLTSMHISILFAISALASELREESYPMIFDAPTSSFGETKSTEFLNLIHETGRQKLLLVKDFIYTDEKTKKLSIKKEFDSVKRDKAFWVQLERPFDKKNLKTLNTLVIPL